MMARLIGNHRQHAGREVEREPAEQDDQQDGERSAAVEKPLRGDALFGVADELEKVAAPDVAAGRAEHVESLEPGDGGAFVGARRAGCAGARARAHLGSVVAAGGPVRAAGRQLLEHVGVAPAVD